MVRVGRYRLTDTLGIGAFGKVKLGVDDDTGEEVAVKLMDKKDILENEFTMQVRREIAIMKALKHRNIVELKEVLTSRSRIYVVLEYVRGGELYDVLEKSGRMDETTSRGYFQQLVDGVDYCHRRGISHRDLKFENLLLAEDGSLKVTDFGLSAMKGEAHLLFTQCGTLEYCAPEIITSAESGYDGTKVDSWACGIILFALLAGYLPFTADDASSLCRRILRNDFTFPPWFSPEAIDMVNCLLAPDPDKRHSMAKIKQHPWFLRDYVDYNAIEKKKRRDQRRSDRKAKKSSALGGRNRRTSLDYSADTAEPPLMSPSEALLRQGEALRGKAEIALSTAEVAPENQIAKGEEQPQETCTPHEVSSAVAPSPKDPVVEATPPSSQADLSTTPESFAQAYRTVSNTEYVRFSPTEIPNTSTSAAVQESAGKENELPVSAKVPRSVQEGDLLTAQQIEEHMTENAVSTPVTHVLNRIRTSSARTTDLALPSDLVPAKPVEEPPQEDCAEQSTQSSELGTNEVVVDQDREDRAEGNTADETANEMAEKMILPLTHSTRLPTPPTLLPEPPREETVTDTGVEAVLTSAEEAAPLIDNDGNEFPMAIPSGASDLPDWTPPSLPAEGREGRALDAQDDKDDATVGKDREPLSSKVQEPELLPLQTTDGQDTAELDNVLADEGSLALGDERKPSATEQETKTNLPSPASIDETDLRTGAFARSAKEASDGLGLPSASPAHVEAGQDELNEVQVTKNPESSDVSQELTDAPFPALSVTIEPDAPLETTAEALSAGRDRLVSEGTPVEDVAPPTEGRAADMIPAPERVEAAAFAVVEEELEEGEEADLGLPSVPDKVEAEPSLYRAPGRSTRALSLSAQDFRAVTQGYSASASRQSGEHNGALVEQPSDDVQMERGWLSRKVTAWFGVNKTEQRDVEQRADDDDTSPRDKNEDEDEAFSEDDGETDGMEMVSVRDAHNSVRQVVRDWENRKESDQPSPKANSEEVAAAVAVKELLGVWEEMLRKGRGQEPIVSRKELSQFQRLLAAWENSQTPSLQSEAFTDALTTAAQAARRDPEPDSTPDPAPEPAPDPAPNSTHTKLHEAADQLVGQAPGPELDPALHHGSPSEAGDTGAAPEPRIPDRQQRLMNEPVRPAPKLFTVKSSPPVVDRDCNDDPNDAFGIAVNAVDESIDEGISPTVSGSDEAKTGSRRIQHFDSVTAFVPDDLGEFDVTEINEMWSKGLRGHSTVRPEIAPVEESQPSLQENQPSESTVEHQETSLSFGESLVQTTPDDETSESQIQAKAVKSLSGEGTPSGESASKDKIESIVSSSSMGGTLVGDSQVMSSGRLSTASGEGRRSAVLRSGRIVRTKSTREEERTDVREKLGRMFRKKRADEKTTQFNSPLPLRETINLVGRILVEMGADVFMKKNRRKLKLSAPVPSKDKDTTATRLLADIYLDPIEGEATLVWFTRSRTDNTSAREFLSVYNDLHLRFLRASTSAAEMPDEGEET